MGKVISKDGTEIAFEKQGSGRPVILVDGALCYRGFGPMPGLAKLLELNFTVYTYDRRGRGESGNTQPYALEREVEDLDALIREAGGEASLLGLSSGACLALETAIRLGGKVNKLAMYEAPYNADPGSVQAWREYRKKLDNFVAEDRRGDAATLFMQFVGTPAGQIDGMRQAPVWSTFEAVAPTLPYDATVLGEDRYPPVERAARVNVPALVMDGGASMAYMPFMHDSATRLAQSIPHAEQRTLEGQRHDVDVNALAPVLVEFFNK